MGKNNKRNHLPQDPELHRNAVRQARQKLAEVEANIDLSRPALPSELKVLGAQFAPRRKNGSRRG